LLVNKMHNKLLSNKINVTVVTEGNKFAKICWQYSNKHGKQVSCLVISKVKFIKRI